MKVISVGTDPKTIKGMKYDVHTGIIYFAPHTSADGVHNVCAFASPLCIIGCLNKAGKGGLNSVQLARQAKTIFFFRDRPGFLKQTQKETEALARKAHRLGLIPAIRPNGLADLAWEKMLPMEENGRRFGVVYYDYTKNPQRMVDFLEGKLPTNYHLTFSRSETNGNIARAIIASGGNVAAVFSRTMYARVVKARTFAGCKVIDGDDSDCRFLDKRAKGTGPGYIVALKAKGPARTKGGAFVIEEGETSL